jgi:aromatic-L-amino-acid decarboxylase
MSAEQFRRLGYRAIDWVADYMERVESFPVLARVEPGEVLARLPEHPPATGLAHDDWDQVFDDLEHTILPGVTHWQSPNFFAYFPCNMSGPAALGDLLSTGLGIQGMLWATSPAATELEMRMLDWMAELVGLPESFWCASDTGGGCIQATASEATLVAMIAAQHRVLRGGGVDRNKLVAYASNQAHSSVLKAAMIVGLCEGAAASDQLRFIDCDHSFRMRPDALAATIAADLAAGRVPFFVCATVGTTSSTAVDPLPEIADTLRETGFADNGGWLHVDAALAGAACVCPEHRSMLDGVEHADSVCFNPHKWLLTSFDCDCFWTRDRDSLTGALSVTPEYLRNRASETGQVVDYRDWQIPLGRRFRALKLWLVIRHYGANGLQAHIREHVRLAGLFENLVDSDPRFEVVAPRALALVCFRLRGEGEESDRRNLDLLERLNATGAVYLTHTSLDLPDTGTRVVLRMSIGAPATKERHVRAAWDRIRELA